MGGTDSVKEVVKYGFKCTTNRNKLSVKVAFHLLMRAIMIPTGEAIALLFLT